MNSKIERLIVPLNMALKMAKLAADAERDGDSEQEEMYLKNLYIAFKSSIRYFEKIDMNFPERDIKNSERDIKNSERDTKNYEYDMKNSDLDTTTSDFDACLCGRIPVYQYLLIQGVFAAGCLCGCSVRGKTYKQLVRNWNKKVMRYTHEKN